MSHAIIVYYNTPHTCLSLSLTSAYNRGSVGPGQHGYDNNDEEMQVR